VATTMRSRRGKLCPAPHTALACFALRAAQRAATAPPGNGDLRDT
jgi:hypothetical protein